MMSRNNQIKDSLKELYQRVCNALEKTETKNSKPQIAEKFKRQRRRFKLNK
jgi:hypothetical protein|tara:strand:- start:947 stop:1099 length:153 start_codon:yes stop_codon:yes gene_type:complete